MVWSGRRLVDRRSESKTPCKDLKVPKARLEDGCAEQPDTIRYTVNQCCTIWTVVVYFDESVKFASNLHLGYHGCRN
jgi:hypothetical protein